MANVLEKIVADKKLEIAGRKVAEPLASFINDVTPSQRDFHGALAAPGTHYILECKKASPSKGLIRDVFNLDEITTVYKKYATCISVLTDEKYFQGNFNYLKKVRESVNQPLIGKDFYIDEYQVYYARLHGADAILLMLSVLDDAQYQALATVARSLNMSILTEVSNEEEVMRAFALDANIIGINNRNLRDLSTDLATTEHLRSLIPTDKVVISESGIYTHDDVKRLRPLCNGFLVGSSLMAQTDLDLACRTLIYGQNKVCGLTRTDDAIAAYNNGAVYGGLIFYPKSPRFVDFDCAQAIVQSAPLKFVGVFVNADVTDIIEHAQRLQLHAIQLHGQEDSAFIATLKAQLPTGCEVWKAHSVAKQLPELVQGADRYLFDTHSDTLAGGTGQQFDWQLLDEQAGFMLAGGLNSQNIKQARGTHAIGLDINSGVETSPGKKCPTKIAAVFANLKNE